MWGGQLMHSPEEAYSYAHSHGSPLSEEQFFSRYDNLRPAAQEPLQEAAGPSAMPPTEFMLPPGHERLQVRGAPAAIASARSKPTANTVRQALLAAHVLQRLRSLAALHQAAV